MYFTLLFSPICFETLLLLLLLYYDVGDHHQYNVHLLHGYVV